MHAKEYLLLDVREKEEYDAGHLAGAINIPRGFLEVKADLTHHKRDPILEDRSRKIICYCGGGFRSVLATDVLLQMGFTDVMSMNEGYTGWVNRQLPVAKEN